MRPEAWRIAPAGGAGLAAQVQKCAYLGSVLELTLQSELGSIFVVSPDMGHAWAVGDAVTLSLAGRGVTLLAGP